MTWAREIDYESTYKMLLQELRKTDLKEGEHALTRRLYLIILLTQLRNGIRLGEAVEFIEMATKTLQREAAITRRGGKQKRVVLPEEITKADLLIVRGVLEEGLKKGKKRFVGNISAWTWKRLGINSYSLSKALEKYLQEKYGVEVETKRKRRKRLVRVFE